MPNTSVSANGEAMPSADRIFHLAGLLDAGNVEGALSFIMANPPATVPARFIGSAEGAMRWRDRLITKRRN